MSLILRKQCQDALDTFGLTKYHVQIQEQGKHLAIVGECGKPLIHIFGIRFTRLVPSGIEIDYATDLFDNFLGIHGGMIKEYIIKAKAFKKVKKVKDRIDQVYIDDNTDYDSDLQEHIIKSYDIQIKDGLAVFNYRSNPKGDNVRFRNGMVQSHQSVTLEKLTNFKANKTLLAKAKKHLKAYIKYENTFKEMEELKEKLNQCDV